MMNELERSDCDVIRDGILETASTAKNFIEDSQFPNLNLRPSEYEARVLTT
jgi:hypothetical protein